MGSETQAGMSLRIPHVYKYTKAVSASGRKT